MSLTPTRREKDKMYSHVLTLPIFVLSHALSSIQSARKTGSMSPFESDFLLKQVYRRRDELGKRGIVDWGALKTANQSTFIDALPIPGPSFHTQAASKARLRVSAWEFGCHLYFLSGLWYPTSAADISYRYNASIKGFERSGQGPWLTKEPFYYGSFGNTPSGSLPFQKLSEIPEVEPVSDMLQVYISRAGENSTDATGAANSGRRVASKFAVDKDIFGASEIRRLENSFHPVTALPRDSLTSLAFSLVRARKVPQFEVRSSSVRLGVVDSPETMNAWLVELSMATFNVAVVESVTPSIARFLSDFFGYFFFFTGLSVFSTIVGPANIIAFGLRKDRQRPREGNAVPGGHVAAADEVRIEGDDARQNEQPGR